MRPGDFAPLRRDVSTRVGVTRRFEETPRLRPRAKLAREKLGLARGFPFLFALDRLNFDFKAPRDLIAPLRAPRLGARAARLNFALGDGLAARLNVGLRPPLPLVKTISFSSTKAEISICCSAAAVSSRAITEGETVANRMTNNPTATSHLGRLKIVPNIVTISISLFAQPN